MSSDTITEYRHAEADYKMAHAKAVVAHRGEGNDTIILALAAVDCEDEYRRFMEAFAAYEKWNADVVSEAAGASAEYHRSWASKQREWTE